jgi:hypothetical protein
VSGTVNDFTIGLKTENDSVAIINEWENWLGRQIGVYVVFLDGGGDWNQLSGASFYADRVRPIMDRTIIEWSVPIFPDSWDYHGGYNEVINGSRDGVFARQAREIADATPPHMPIYIRIGWKFNGLFPWDTCGPWLGDRWANDAFTANEELGGQGAYRAAFRRIVSVYRATRPERFTFVFCPGNFTYTADYDWERVWPGDDVVDIYSIDCYYDTDYVSTDPHVAFEHLTHGIPYGFSHQRDRAVARGKRLAISEWGVDRNSSADWCRLLGAWCRDNRYRYAAYWEEPIEPFIGKLRDNRFPDVTQAMRETFGANGTAYEGGAPLPPPPPATGAVITGTPGPDTLTGGTGPDTIFGEAGDDALFGGGGDDILDPGPGAGFYIEGGAGVDTMIYKRGPPGYGAGTFQGFAVGIDRIRTHGYAASEITISPHTHEGQNGQIVLFFGGGHIWLPGVLGLTMDMIEVLDPPGTSPPPPPPPPQPPPPLPPGTVRRVLRGANGGVLTRTDGRPLLSADVYPVEP